MILYRLNYSLNNIQIFSESLICDLCLIIDTHYEIIYIPMDMDKLANISATEFTATGFLLNRIETLI